MHLTRLLDQSRRKKSEPIFDLLGDLDEVNCFLGSARVIAPRKLRSTLLRLQKTVLLLASLVAGKKASHKLKQEQNWLQQAIKKWEANLTPKSFVLPGKNELAVRLHLARAVVRRAERRAVAVLSTSETKDQIILDYLNRLSWFLFLLAWKRGQK